MRRDYAAPIVTQEVGKGDLAIVGYAESAVVIGLFGIQVAVYPIGTGTRFRGAVQPA